MKRAILILLLLASPLWATDRYLRSTDGNDSDDGSTWALAKATLAGAFTASSAGDRIFVSDNHAETQASAMTLTSPGTAASPVQIICVDDAAEPPTARATTATVTTTGNSSITSTGFAYCYGITFNAGTTAVSPNFTATTWTYDTCTINRLATGAGVVQMTNCTLRNATVRNESNNSATGGLLPIGRIDWVGGTFTRGAAVAAFTTSNAAHGTAFVSGVDLSGFGSGHTILVANNNGKRRVVLANCKLGASVTVMGTPTTPVAEEIELINCDSGNTNYRYHKQNYAGTITQETTIVRSGGATDGTTPIAHKFVTTANSKFYAPLYGPWLTFWNETTGSAVAVTAETVTDNVTLTDAEAWIEVEYLGTSGFPLSVIATDQVSDPVFGTPANQTTSTVTWTTTGLTTPVTQKLSTSVTPQVKGPIRARVVLAKPSTTMYTCPKVRP